MLLESYFSVSSDGIQIVIAERPRGVARASPTSFVEIEV